MVIRTPELDIERVLFTEEEIANRVKALGEELTQKFFDKRPIMVCVLKGASYFCIDLCRAMKCHLDMDFIAVSSYANATKSSGIVKLVKDLDSNIENRHVILVEDIIDSGLTLKYLHQLFSSRNPASISTVSFLKKNLGKQQAFQDALYGFEVPDAFVVGYGLDYAGNYRNLPYIGVLKPECYR